MISCFESQQLAGKIERRNNYEALNLDILLECVLHNLIQPSYLFVLIQYVYLILLILFDFWF